jgi:hypothetical protein
MVAVFRPSRSFLISPFSYGTYLGSFCRSTDEAVLLPATSASSSGTGTPDLEVIAAVASCTCPSSSSVVAAGPSPAWLLFTVPVDAAVGYWA